MAIADRNRARRQVCGVSSAQLRTRTRDSQPGTLPGCVGEEARRHGGIHATGAMEAGRTLAGVSGSNLEETRGALRQERRNPRDDRLGSRWPEQWMGWADQGSGGGLASWGNP